MTSMARDPSNDLAFQRELCDWITANGLNPMQVCADPEASIADGKLTLIRNVWRDGHAVLNADGSAILTETVTVPVVVEPSPDIAEWLRPRCGACGR